jgi:hypothetical protein
MKPDDLQQILLSEKPITPSSSFAANVMSRVQAEAEPPFRSPFPWIPFALTAPMVILAVLYGRADPALRALGQLSYKLAEWITAPADAALRNTILSAFSSLLGTLLVIRFSLRLTGAKRN